MTTTHGANDYFAWHEYRASQAVGITFKRGYFKHSELEQLIGYLQLIEEAMYDRASRVEASTQQEANHD
jgi:hypothetical protein